MLSRGSNREVAFPVHSACWDIFVQDYALLPQHTSAGPDLDVLGRILSTQRLFDHGRGLRPSWTHGYKGAEQFWDDGWREHPEPEASNIAGILKEDDFDYLVKDPHNVGNIDQVLVNPPLRSSEENTPIKTSIIGHCPFSHLPAEILVQILSFLPTPSVRNMRLASRLVASVHLPVAYWHSRFQYPNELSHITLPAHLSNGRFQGRPMDWQIFCHRLLYPTHNECMKNRRRISSLTKTLIIELTSPSHSARHTSVSPAPAKESLCCQQRIAAHGAKVSGRSSVIFDDISTLGAIHRITCKFRSPRFVGLRGEDTLTGLCLYGDRDVRILGKCEEEGTKSVTFDSGAVIRRVVVTMQPMGIIGLQIVTSPMTSPEILNEFTFGSSWEGTPLGRSEGDLKGLTLEMSEVFDESLCTCCLPC